VSQIAFVGLGNMGLPMATRLVGAGHDVVGFDLSAEARRRLETAGGSSASTLPGSVGSADFVVLMLPDSAVVESVLQSAEFRESAPVGALIVDMSSSEPSRTQALAKELAVHARRLIDAPVSGGVPRARTGELTVMAGGPPDDVALAAQALASLGAWSRVGDVGAGHAAKALNNLLSAGHLLLTSEALVAGERFGIEPEALLGVINTSSGRSGSSELKWPRYVLTGAFDSGFSLGLLLKDAKIALGLIEEYGVDEGLAAETVAGWTRASAELPANADHTDIARWVRGASG
jgi:3-hydroxyisobutyrate dehydrogenase